MHLFTFLFSIKANIRIKFKKCNKMFLIKYDRLKKKWRFVQKQIDYGSEYEWD